MIIEGDKVILKNDIRKIVYTVKKVINKLCVLQQGNVGTTRMENEVTLLLNTNNILERCEKIKKTIIDKESTIEYIDSMGKDGIYPTDIISIKILNELKNNSENIENKVKKISEIISSYE